MNVQQWIAGYSHGQRSYKRNTRPAELPTDDDYRAGWADGWTDARKEATCPVN